MNTTPILYQPNFLPNADELFDRLWKELKWVDVAGPRLEYYVHDMGLPYTYGTDSKFARTYESQVDHAAINEIRQAVEKFTGCRFEVCFINGYRDGQDHLGWHRDYSDDSRPIVIVSLGAEREIFFRENPSKCYACNGSGKYDVEGSPNCSGCDGTGRKPNEIHKLRLGHGSLCEMKPGMQETHQHRIPKSDRHNCPPRISLTFRGYAEERPEGLNEHGFEDMEKDDWKALTKLRATMELKTHIPHTIFTFAAVRFHRHEHEMRKMEAITETARKELFKIIVSLGSYSKRMNSSEDCSDIPEKLKEMSNDLLGIRDSLKLP